MPVSYLTAMIRDHGLNECGRLPVQLYGFWLSDFDHWICCTPTLDRLPGVAADSIILDPGIGFGKGREHNLRLINALPRLAALGHPLLLGVSRKRFMGSICQVSDPTELVAATCACTALGVMAGVAIFRVHDVAENRQAADLAWALKQAGATG